LKVQNLGIQFHSENLHLAKQDGFHVSFGNYQSGVNLQIILLFAGLQNSNSWFQI